ncbi:MAG: cobyrinate a,c-diamide synthase [Nitrospirae bacterium]|nr:cobyrinate a,c-diamide synthase [Nitrospirota bacterium]
MTQSHHYSIPRIVVSGLRGGSGKTILSLCLITNLRKKGLKVIPFKKGPDYIDAGWLAKAAGTPCYNLDLFMMTPEQALQSFVEHTLTPSPSSPPVKGGENTPLNPLLIEGKVPSPLAGEGQGEGGFPEQIAVIEGNRGLYDGVDHKGTYSTAELAKLLKAPVIIIVDCTKATNTIAAMILGCQKMDSGVLIGGVVLNQVATARQEGVIRKAVEGKCKAPVVGAIPRLRKDPFPERHMGLTPFQERLDVEGSLAAAAEIGEKYLDIEAVLKIANGVEPLGIGKEPIPDPRSPITVFTNPQPPTPNPFVKIGIVRDSAFQFYYQENFEELEKRGAQLIEVSPLRETSIPDIDALYIGGGFPETHAIALAENVSFRNSLYNAIQNGLPVYAECGGLMYLGNSLILEGKPYPMVGALPITFDLEKKPQAHGYTIVEVESTNPFYPLKTVLKGHEFHYSRVLTPPSSPLVKGGNTPLTLSPLERGAGVCNRGELNEGDAGGFSGQIYFAFNMKRGKGIIGGKDGMCYKNVLATYTHLHAIGSPEWADGLVNCARKFKDSK